MFVCVFQTFRKYLTKMFSERNQDVVFMETSMHLKRFPHMHIECVPMDKEVGDLAPIYFKVKIYVKLGIALRIWKFRFPISQNI